MAGIDVTTASRNRLRAKKQGGGVVTVKGEEADKADTSATDREALQSGLGSGKAKGSAGTGMPKQSDYPDMGSFSEAMRKWRDKQRGATMDHAGAALAGRLK